LGYHCTAVTNSAFYNTGFWDTFIGYNHLSGSAYKSGNKINFTANGEIILKIIWQGVELKRLPTNSSVGIMILIKKYTGN
jgi:regulation of enolase protein 1 (concanavalin A-like superfamily)